VCTHRLIALTTMLMACAPEDDMRRVPFLRVPVGSMASLSFDLEVVDFEGDGQLELAVAGGKHEPAPNRLFHSSPPGLLNHMSYLGELEDSTFGLDFGDLDGDGLMDFVAANDVGDKNRVCLQTLQGDFDCMSKWASWNSRDVDLADLDGDGLLDMVFVNKRQQDRIFYGGNLSWFDAPKVAIGGEDDDPEPMLLAFGDEDRPSVASAIGDLDNDGYPDIVVASRGVQPTGVHLMGPQGVAHTHYLKLGNTRAVELVDIDDDGALDLVVGNLLEPNLLLYNLGDGHFDTPREVGPEPSNTWALAVADLDGDGLPDLIEGNAFERDHIRYGTPDGGFGPSQALGHDATDTRDIVVADFDADGDMDIAVARNRQQDLIYLNQRW